MHVVIFTGGVLRDGRFVRQALTKADLVIAADSGAQTALDFQTLPKVVIGDFDSLDEDTQQLLKRKGCELIVCNPEKDETDTELALQYALGKNASQITLLGGIEGDRIDHILANIFLLADQAIPLRCVNGSTAVWAQSGPAAVQIAGRSKDILSLLPLTPEVSGIKTNGLQYPLSDETLTMGISRGISNILIKDQATVKFTQGTLLFVHTGEIN